MYYFVESIEPDQNYQYTFGLNLKSKGRGPYILSQLVIRLMYSTLFCLFVGLLLFICKNIFNIAK